MLALVRLFQRFTFALPEGHDGGPLKHRYGATITPLEPVSLVVKQR